MAQSRSSDSPADAAVGNTRGVPSPADPSNAMDTTPVPASAPTTPLTTSTTTRPSPPRFSRSFVPTVLTIAGSDSSGGAGLQADMKTITALGGYACTAITAITAQNTKGVDAVQLTSPEVLAAQIRAVHADYPIGAIKIGMIGSADAARVILAELNELPRTIPVIWDPVMVASSGSALFEQDEDGTTSADQASSDVPEGQPGSIDADTDQSGTTDEARDADTAAEKATATPNTDNPLLALARRADLITPNGRELLALCQLAGTALPAPSTSAPTNSPTVTLAEIESLASQLSSRLGTAVLATGGPDNGITTAESSVCDVLALSDVALTFTGRRIHTANTHGTGCSFSSALAVFAAYAVAGASSPGERCSRGDGEEQSPRNSAEALPASEQAGESGMGSAQWWRGVVKKSKEWMEGALAGADSLDCAIGAGWGLARGEGDVPAPGPAHPEGNAPLDHFWQWRE